MYEYEGKAQNENEKLNENRNRLIRFAKDMRDASSEVKNVIQIKSF